MRQSMFGFGSSLGLPMFGHTPAQTIPVDLSTMPAGEQPTQGSQIMGLLGQVWGAANQAGLIGATPYNPATGSAGASASRMPGGEIVHWLPQGSTYGGFQRYGGSAQGAVRGMGGRLGGGV